MGKKVFDNPKSINLLKKIIKFSTSENDFILDFFAGSGSTAQAVSEVNNELGSKRKYILVEQMDYIQTVTIPRIQKTTEGDFVYAELATAHSYLKRINDSENVEEIKIIVKDIQNNGYCQPEIETDLEEILNSNNGMDISILKKMVFSILDMNMIYIPYSDMDDSENDLDYITKSLNNKFYNMSI